MCSTHTFQTIFTMPMRTADEQREYQRQWMATRRQQWIEANGPCANCRSTQNLEIDHIDPTTKVIAVSRLWSYSRVKREAELRKCQVLCEQCHSVKTETERNLLHGEQHPLAVLSDEQIRYVRSAYSPHGRGGGKSGKRLAIELGVSKQYISAVVRLKTRTC